MTCTVEGCGRRHLARGWCGRHYLRWYRHGDALREPSWRPPCTVAGCERTATGRGWCLTHYTRWRRTGDPLRVRDRVMSAGALDRLRAAMRGNRLAKDAPVKGECIYCGAVARTLDHVIPRGRPGWDAPGNTLPACWACNASKGDRTPAEWFAAMAPA